LDWNLEIAANKPKYIRQVIAKKEWTSTQRNVQPQKVWSQKDQQRSFTQVVKNENVSITSKDASDTTPHIRIEVESSKWLEKCFVGRLLEAIEVQSVDEHIFITLTSLIHRLLDYNNK